MFTAVLHTLPERGGAVLAVSGGVDSMTLLHLASNARRERECELTVATFDHASGPHTARAVKQVVAVALQHALPVVVGHAEGSVNSEAGWRAERWKFLQSVSRSSAAVILTAHTRDDQIETVLMRAMRGAGARGLAGLRAPSMVRRPLLDVTRRDVEGYATTHGLQWVDDPTNESCRYLRNRIRHDLLPALRRVRPSIDADLTDIGDRAGEWRSSLSGLVEKSLDFHARRDSKGAWLEISAADLTEQSSAALAILWPELASRVGLALDRRGMSRAVEFTLSGRAGTRIQLSGGWELLRSRSRFELRMIETGVSALGDPEPLRAPMTWGCWTFRHGVKPLLGDPWHAGLPTGRRLSVRSWRAGDRLLVRLGDRLVSRKVKYFLSDAGISGHIRARWPVVLAGDEIVWIPGIRRSDAATARSGRPVVIYVCDYLDRRS
jgi:tRNA(Ile)-lysidine synthase